MLVTATVDRLAPPDAEALTRAVEEPIQPAGFRAAFDRWTCLHAIEAVPSPAEASPKPSSARVVFWNAERLKYSEPSVSLLESAQADILLLCEVDVGMARSGNRHTVADLAARLGTGYLFGVEFVELGLGDSRERAWHAGSSNCAGLHGAALLSRHQLRRPALARLETSGRWYDGQFGERRVGGRIALMAELMLETTAVLFACAHYESHSDADDRRRQTIAMLDAIDAHAPSLPVLIAGDFNTSTFPLNVKHQPADVAAALSVDPHRLVAPMPYEPMFEALRERGYEWESCNVALAPTQRTRPDGTPAPPFGKIDWLFTRGLQSAEPEIIAAVDAQGIAISDHEALVVTVVPA